MDRPGNWIGAGIEWRIRVTAESDVVFEEQIDTAEDYGDGVTRISRCGGERRPVRTGDRREQPC